MKIIKCNLFIKKNKRTTEFKTFLGPDDKRKTANYFAFHPPLYILKYIYI